MEESENRVVIPCSVDYATLKEAAMKGSAYALELLGEGTSIRFERKEYLIAFMKNFIKYFSPINLVLYEEIQPEGPQDAWVHESLASGDRTDGEVIIGFYPDTQDGIDEELASFFHELSHCLYGKDEEALTKYDVESRMWEKGFKLMEKYHLEVTQKMREHAETCLATYNTPVNTEPTCLPFTMKAAEITATSIWKCPYCKETISIGDHSFIQSWFDVNRYSKGEVMTSTGYCRHCHKPFTLFAEIGRG